MKILMGVSRSKPAFEKYLWTNFRKFLLIGVIVSLVLIPAYQEAIRSTKKTSTYAIESDLRAGFNQLNQSFVRLCNQAVIIANEDNIARVTSKRADDPLVARDFFTMLQAKKFMGNAIFMDGLLANAYLISRYNSIFLSDTIVSENRSQIYGTFYYVEGWSEEKWLEEVLSVPQNSTGFQGSFLPTVQANTVYMPHQVNVKTDILHLVIPTTSVASNYNRYFVYMIDVNEMFARMKIDRYIENGFLYIMDDKGQILASTGYEGEAIDASVNSVRFQDENCTLMREEFPGTRLTAVMGVPDSYFISQLAPTQRLLTVFSMGVLLVALLASLGMAYLQFKPIRLAMEAVEKANPQPQTEKSARNEYQYIAETVVSLDNTRKRYEEEMQQMTASVQSTMMDRIIHGKVMGDEDFDRFREMFGVEQTRFLFVIMRISMGQEDSAFSESLELTIRINHLLQEKLPTEEGVQYLYYHGEPLTTQMLFCLPEGEENGEAIGQLYYRVLSDVQRAMLEETGVLVTFGIGEVVNGVREIPQSRKAASNVLRYTDAEKPVLLTTGAVMGRSPLTGYHTRRLMTLLKEAQIDLVEDFFYEFIDSIGKNSLLPEETLRQIFYSIRGSLETVSETVRVDGGELDLPEFAADVRMRNLILSFVPACKKLCEQIESKQKEQQELKRHEIVTYIQESYADNSLCALSIAEHFGVAEKYVFQVVKSCTGVTLGEFIEKLRFEEAERLLLGGTDLTELPTVIGFNSVNTFYKAFKRVYGTSPGRWRDARMAEEKERTS